MEAERRKSIVAAILAVHSGRMSPDEAAEFLQDPGKVAESIKGLQGGVPVITLSSGDGEFSEYDLIAVVDDEEKSRRALADIGIEPRAQDTLFSFGNHGGDGRNMKVLRDTLQQVAGTGSRLTKSEMKAGSTEGTKSEQPTLPPQDQKTRTMRLTTSKFMANFGVSQDRYDVRKEHARGGMGRVLLVRDKAIGRDIAMKELLPGVGSGASIPAGASGESGGIVERFLREAKITGQLEHPNIIPVYEIGQHQDGSVYYTMRFIRGMTLADKLREIRKDEALDRKGKLAARIGLLDGFLDVCDALSYAHSKGVIHRDLKPENIMLGEYGETLVLDWGLARVKGQEDKAMRELQKGTLALSRSLMESDSQQLTQDGSIVGTPAYMAPEQARGELENVDEQSDVYALGAVLYQILSGSPPYEGPMAGLIVQQVLAGPPLRLTAREPEVPPELGALVDHAMAREKYDRLRSVAELAADIKAFRNGATLGVYKYSAREMVTRFVRQHRTSVGISVLGILLLVAGALYAYQQVSTERDDARSAQVQAELARQSAQANADRADRERARREQLEKDEIARAQRDLESRVDDAKKLLTTIEGMRIDQIRADLDARIANYEAQARGLELPFLELSLDERVSNGVLLASVMGYVSSQQTLVDLLTGPAGARLPDALNSIDLADQRERLQTLRLGAARLATFNGDFPLAELMLSGVGNAGLAKAAREAVQTARTGLLELHAQRIDEALTDVRNDLRRAGRTAPAPTLADYVKQLSSYRESQTVTKLDPQVADLRKRCRDPLVTWSAADLDLVVLVCRVLGAVERPKETVPLLQGLLLVARHPRVINESAQALCTTKSADAVDPLLAEMRTRGMDFWAGIEVAAGALALPERLRQPQGASDYLDASVMLRAKSDYPGAIDAATRASVLDAMAPEPLLQRGLARARAGDNKRAQEDFQSALRLDGKNFEAMLARGDTRDLRAEGDQAIEDYAAAINLRPLDVRGYLRRARAYGQRYMFDQAFVDYDRAVNLNQGRVETYIEYGDLLFRRGRLVDAEAQYDIAIGLEPENWLGWHSRGVLRRENNFNGSMADLKRAVTLNDRDAKAWDWMSQVYYGMGALIQGIEAATKAVEIDPNEWLAYYYRGITYLRLQDAEDARANEKGDATASTTRITNLSRAADDFAQAARINPQDYRSIALGGSTLLSLERFDEARESFLKALALSPFGAGTLQMGNEFVKAGLLEIAAQPLLTREAANNDERIQKARAHIGRQVRNKATREADLRQSRAQLQAVRAALQAGELNAKQRYRYEQVESLFLAALREHGYWVEFVGALDDMASRRKLDGDELAERGQAKLALRSAVVTRAAKFLESDETARAAAMAEFAALRDDQVLKRGTELLESAVTDLEAAMEAGWSDPGVLNELVRTHPLAGNARYEELRAKAKAAGHRLPVSRSGQAVVVITNVIELAPASRIGLRAFDVVTAINGKPVSSVQEFQGTLGPLPEGTDIEFSVRRYVLTHGQPTPRKDANGEVVRNADGLATWEYSDVVIRGKRGFMGINLENGIVPMPEEE
ncbi:MAG: protein kinase [Planctomycetes bacterium]|nr:protein kinase [Planctomycetota bacterium]